MCYRAISEDRFVLVYCHNKCKTQKMCNEALNDCLASLKFFSDWFVTSKMIKNFVLLYTQIIIYSILIKILEMSYFLVMKWVFLV